MIMPRKLNDGCKGYQDERRQQTIQKVQTAINKLRDEGAIITIGKLVELTGLTRSTFEKAHVVEILKINKVCQFENKTVIAQEKNNSLLAVKLEKELENSNKTITKLTQELEKQKAKYLQLQSDQIKKAEDYQLLLGNWHTLVKRAKILGIDILDS